MLQTSTYFCRPHVLCLQTYRVPLCIVSAGSMGGSPADGASCEVRHERRSTLRGVLKAHSKQ